MLFRQIALLMLFLLSSQVKAQTFSDQSLEPVDLNTGSETAEAATQLSDSMGMDGMQIPEKPDTKPSQLTRPLTSPMDPNMPMGKGAEMVGTPPQSAQKAFIMTNMMREGSGTGWQPSENPMLMKMGRIGAWTTMLHGNVFADFDYQGGRRGNYKAVSENWFMGSASRAIGSHDILQLRGMVSAEPFTAGKNGYPLLFQTGEALRGKALLDRQHPHDLFMELSAQYFHPLAKSTWLSLYLAPVGEPALGPVAFPHRYSDFLIPTAPLGHHILDSTHVSFGVATVGVIHKQWQLEGSVFNSREPDDNRYDFDYNTWHTGASGRLSYMPSPRWAFQVSSGYLSKPEELDNNNLVRGTASGSYNRTWVDGWWANTLALGHNFEPGADDNSVLLESTVNFKEKNYAFSRIENVQRHGIVQQNEGKSYNITSFSVGVARDLFKLKRIPLTLGAMITMYAKPGALNAHYSDFPLSFNVFLYTNAPRMDMAGM